MKNPVLLEIGGGKLDAGYSILGAGFRLFVRWRQLKKLKAQGQRITAEIAENAEGCNRKIPC
jgi:hypothetical protein